MEEILELRQQKTRRSLFNSLTNLLTITDKQHCIKVVDICEKADISYITFYAHFDNKFDLLHHLIQDQLENIFPIPKMLKPHSIKQLSKYLLNFLVSFCKNNKKLIINSIDRAKARASAGNYIDTFFQIIKARFYDEMILIYKSSNHNVLLFWSDLITNALFHSIVNKTYANEEINSSVILNNVLIMLKSF